MVNISRNVGDLSTSEMTCGECEFCKEGDFRSWHPLDEFIDGVIVVDGQERQVSWCEAHWLDYGRRTRGIAYPTREMTPPKAPLGYIENKLDKATMDMVDILDIYMPPTAQSAMAVADFKKAIRNIKLALSEFHAVFNKKDVE